MQCFSSFFFRPLRTGAIAASVFYLTLDVALVVFLIFTLSGTLPLVPRDRVSQQSRASPDYSPVFRTRPGCTAAFWSWVTVWESDDKPGDAFRFPCPMKPNVTNAANNASAVANVTVDEATPGEVTSEVAVTPANGNGQSNSTTAAAGSDDKEEEDPRMNEALEPRVRVRRAGCAAQTATEGRRKPLRGAARSERPVRKCVVVLPMTRDLVLWSLIVHAVLVLADFALFYAGREGKLRILYLTLYVHVGRFTWQCVCSGLLLLAPAGSLTVAATVVSVSLIGIHVYVGLLLWSLAVELSLVALPLHLPADPQPQSPQQPPESPSPASEGKKLEKNEELLPTNVKRV